MKRSLIGLIAAVLMAGCTSTPSDQIAAFGQTTNAVTDHVDAVLNEFNEATIERGFTDLAANYTGDFAQRFDQQLLKDINKPITAKQQKQLAIYRANKALGDYATSLAELANARLRVDVDVASANLYGAMTSFNKHYQTIKGNQKALFDDSKVANIQAAITAIGSEVAEQRRRQAVKAIIIAAKDNIDLICDEIIKQLTHSGIEDGIRLSRKYILDKQIAEYRRLSAKKSSKLKWRTDEVRRLWLLQQALFHSKLLVQQSIKAIEEVKQAHQVLASEVAHDAFSSVAISNAIGRLQYLNKHFNDFEEFLASCDSTATDSDGVLSCE